MLAFKVEGLKEFERKVRKLAEMPEAISRAVNWAATDTVDAVAGKSGPTGLLHATMRRTFDNPTPYVMRGLKKRYPTGNGRRGSLDPMGADKAAVYFEFFGGSGMSPEAVMKRHVFGGARRKKSSERRLEGVIPGAGWMMPGQDATLNRYGNMSGAHISRMLSNFGTIDTAKSSDRGGKRRKTPSTISYYSIPVANGNLIIERRGKSTKRFIFMTNKTPMYRQKVKFDFFEDGSRHMLREFNRFLPEKLFRELKNL